MNLKDITYIKAENDVKNIGDRAFKDTGAEKIYIDEFVSSIGNEAFDE